MADPAQPHALPPASAAVALRILPPQARFVFRGGGPAVAAGGRSFGVALPQEACRAAVGGARAALWLGPDEWLLLASTEDASDIVDAVAASLGATPHALVDISHGQIGLEIAGDGAASLLNTECPLDLDIAAFPVGMCTRTIFAKAQIILWRVSATVFRVACDRSFFDYVRALLAEAEREFAATREARS
jgi:sarcosine oxidase, subunit gamma